MADVKISALELENVKRIRAIQMEPTPNGLTVIGGRNAQGKTSVLDAIAWALGGDKMRPKAPNRDGAANAARLKVELSNGLVVERKGKNGTLYVTDANGMRGGQTLLNAFVSQLALDLPRFMDATDKQRADYLLQILGVDAELAKVDRDIKAAYDERRYVGRDADQKQKMAEGMPRYDDVPDEPISITALSDELQAMLLRNAANQTARNELARMEVTLGNGEREIEVLTAKLKETQQALDAAVASHDAAMSEVETKRAMVAQLVDEDPSELEMRMRSAELINERVAANRSQARAKADADTLRTEYDALTERIEGLRAERTRMLDDAGMPLAGLTVEDGVLSYNGHVWSDMSGAEQLRVATAITRATKPECGFVLVDKLEQFDTQQLAEFAAWAEGEGLQVIGTRVATDDSCTVIIEDGRIVGQEMQEATLPNPRGEALSWGDEF